MIFKKIFEGTDLDFNINLEKTHYLPGEIVRGKITLLTKKGAGVRQLKLFAEGKETTAIEEYIGLYGSSTYSSHTNTNVNTFYSEDLSHLLQNSVIGAALQDGTIEIPPQSKEIGVEFTLPSENKLYSSCKGKNANVTYNLKATADIAKKQDVNKEEIFSVVNPHNNKVKDISSSKWDNRATVNSETMSLPPTTVSKPKDDNTVKESYSARFGSNYDLGTLLAKGREKYLNGNSEAKIDLPNNGINTTFSAGQIIKGNVMTLSLHYSNDKRNKKNIRGMNITLSGIEHAYAQGYQRVSTVEEYDKKIKVDWNGENDSFFPFEFQIPDGVRQSYTGKYSEYFWGLEAKINRAWSSDIIARTIIEIV